MKTNMPAVIYLGKIEKNPIKCYQIKRHNKPP